MKYNKPFKFFVSLITAFTVLCLLFLFFFQKERKSEPAIPKQYLELREVSFSSLTGWKGAHQHQSFQAFLRSCKVFVRQEEGKEVGSRYLALSSRNWLKPCMAALDAGELNERDARLFFEKWFTPLEFYQEDRVEGLFTGYYSPLLQGSLKKTKKYSLPLYGLPKDLVKANLGLFNKELLHGRISGRVHQQQLIPYYSREQINNGALDGKAEAIVWVSDPIDRQFLEIQGSGVIELEDGQRFFVGYAGENGHPFTSLARVLIDKGVMTKDNASMQGIKTYLTEHPEEKKAVLNQNKSFIFFEKQAIQEAMGAQGVALKAGYSLAVDRKWIPLGAPIWLDTSHPSQDGKEEKPFKRLMIAQDTGGAIRGPVRGDVYWGAGAKAAAVAGRMKNPGHYWLLLPKALVKSLASLDNVTGSKTIRLPKA